METLYSIDVAYIRDAADNKFKLRVTNVREKAGDAAAAKDFIVHRLGPHTYGVMDYIMLPSNKSIAVTCKIDAITLIKSGNHVHVEYSVPTTLPRRVN